MARSMRLITIMAVVAVALLAAANIGMARPAVPTARQAACVFGSATTFPCTVNGQVVNSPAEIAALCNANPMACSSAPGGSTGGSNGGAGGSPGGGATGGQSSQIPPSPAGGSAGGMPNIDWGSLAPCAPGQVPSPTAPCKFEMPDCAEGQMPSPQSPCKPKPCAPGARPSAKAPCIPEGQDGGFESPPTSGITKELKNKFMVINISVQGSGEINGSFDVTFKSVEEGVSKATAAFLNEQLEGESFVIETDASTRCFADTKDPDKVPDMVSCKLLDDAANDAPGSIKAQFRGKVSFDPATFQPKFKAQKIIFLKGAFDVAKIK